MEVHIAAVIYYSCFFAAFAGLMVMASRSQRMPSVILSAVFALLLLFSGFRYGLGRDFGMYEFIFQYPVQSGSFEHTEAIWQKGTLVFRALGLNFLDWQLFISCIIIGGFLYGFYKLCGNYWWVATLSFVLIYSGYFESFNIIRQFVSLSIIVGSYHLYLERRYLLWLLFLFIAFLFHASAIIIIPLVLAVTRIRWSDTFVVICLLGSAIVGRFFFQDILSLMKLVVPYYSFYLEGKNVYAMASDSGIYPIFLNVVALFFIYLSRRISRDKDPFYRDYVLYFSLAVILYNVFLNFEIGARLFYYPFAFTFVLLGLSYKHFKSSKIIFAFYFVLFIFSVFMMKNLSNIEEPYSAYRTFFDPVIFKY